LDHAPTERFTILTKIAQIPSEVLRGQNRAIYLFRVMNCRRRKERTLLLGKFARWWIGIHCSRSGRGKEAGPALNPLKGSSAFLPLTRFYTARREPKLTC